MEASIQQEYLSLVKEGYILQAREMCADFMRPKTSTTPLGM
jgi:hypothetical protein